MAAPMDGPCEDVGDNIMKKSKPGLVYLSSIPPTMNVMMIRELFQQYGDVGRVFLQPNSKEKKKGKPAKSFTEGWVEFKKKRIAKSVAQMLNNTQVGGKRRTKYYDCLWNIKYLSGFKWTHLTERLAYEKAVHNQRLRTEISQVKRETNFYVQNVEKKRRMDRAKKRKASKENSELKTDKKIKVDTELDS